MTRYMELAYVRSIYDLLNSTIKPGRLKNLYTKLQAAVDHDLRRLPPIGDSDMLLLREKVRAFGKATGWDRKTRHVVTLLSFCIDLVERSKFPHNPKILETMNLIVEYYERQGRVKFICCKAGAMASEKWNRIVEAT